jgi:hypothetical protein
MTEKEWKTSLLAPVYRIERKPFNCLPPAMAGCWPGQRREQ